MRKLERDEFGLRVGERRIVFLLNDGLSTKQIATILGLSIHTINTYIKRAMRTTETHHRGELVAKVMGRARIWL